MKERNQGEFLKMRCDRQEYRNETQKQRDNTEEQWNGTKEQYYDEFKEPHYTIVEERKPTKERVQYIPEFNNVKDQIFFELIKTGEAEGTKNNLPSTHYLNLSLIYRYSEIENQKSRNKNKSHVIYNFLLQYWGITIQELHERALANTPRLFPIIIRDLDKILFRYQAQTMSSSEKEDLCKKLGGTPIYLPKESKDLHRYLITNPSGCYGAGAMLYQDFLHTSVERLHLEQHKIYLLPSGRNEVVLFACKTFLSEGHFLHVLQWFNENRYKCLPKKERLTQCVYQYLYHTNEIILT